MHQGNLFVDNKGNIIPVDFGIMGRLDKNNRKIFSRNTIWFYSKRLHKGCRSSFSSRLSSQDASKEEFAQALRSVGEPIFGQSIKTYIWW